MSKRRPGEVIKHYAQQAGAPVRPGDDPNSWIENAKEWLRRDHAVSSGLLTYSSDDIGAVYKTDSLEVKVCFDDGRAIRLVGLLAGYVLYGLPA